MRREPLSELLVVRSCPASWTALGGTDRVRHCSQCERNVFNISGLTRPEAKRLIHDTEGRVCARYYMRKDGTILTRDCPLPERVAVKSRVALATLLGFVGISMSTGCVMGQTKEEARHTMELVRLREAAKARHLAEEKSAASVTLGDK